MNGIFSLVMQDLQLYFSGLMLCYGSLPVVLAALQKDPITPVRFLALCAGANVLGSVVFMTLYGTISIPMYVLGTAMFWLVGLGILNMRNLKK